ncbi:phytochrome A1 apoprotein [Panicum miliaceum]|uniref:Phytochrome A1 apoprotein n=1 Tax=Panicum miliaceum TaxID=4540 RepID=A0A3L6Q102_PANMI|nr:phytochrome A1 apoprotein [Panicum miliaceum]
MPEFKERKKKSLKVIAFSENAPEMLTAVSHAVSGVDDSPKLCIGINVVSLFADPGATTLDKVLGFPDVISSLNPIIVQCKTSGRPFYAIVHHVAGCLLVDFEPVNPSEFPAAVVWASQPNKLAATAISKIQSLPGGSMDVLCNTLVEVFDLMRYDRVMAYKFHEDYHGEVIAEITKPGLEPYIGLHYPATDIPQAARFLFMKNKVRIISDCHARPVKIIEDAELPLHASLCGSTLRAPHSCHLQYMKNKNSVASLVIAVVVNEDAGDVEVITKQQTQQHQKKLWGLIICYHGSPRYVPFPLRHACEFIAQVFAIHISKELELEKQMQEKSIIRMQARLSNMLFREACPLSTISGSPNITDLVKCDGAALLYGDKVWQLHTTPTVCQKRDIAIWLSDVHSNYTSLSFDNLQDAACPGLASLSDMICGMAMAKITSSIILFWFRSHTPSEIKWGGAKHNPSDRDDCRRMHPRLSFKAFLEVVRMKSLPWNEYEMDAIDSLQLMVRGSLNEANKLARVPHLNNNYIDRLKSNVFPEVQAAAREMFHLPETATVPIMAVDGNGLVSGRNLKAAQLTGLRADEVLGRHMLTLVEESSLPNVQRVLSLALRDKYGRCNEWNAAIAKLTGWQREEVLHKMLLGEVFHSSNASCLLKDKDDFLSISILINSTLASDQRENQAPFV